MLGTTSIYGSAAEGVTAYRRYLGTSLRPKVMAMTLTIIVVLLATAVHHLRLMLVNVEQQAVKTTEYELLAQLNFAATAALQRRDGEALARLHEANPLDLFGRARDPTAVAVNLADPHDLRPGEWVFDRSRAMLLYRFEHYGGAGAHGSVIGLRARVRYVDRDDDGRFSYPTDLFQGVSIDRIDLESS